MTDKEQYRKLYYKVIPHLLLAMMHPEDRPFLEGIAALMPLDDVEVERYYPPLPDKPKAPWEDDSD